MFRNPAAIERLRPLLRERRKLFPKLDFIPEDVFLRWIDHESGGNYKLRATELGEIGLFQVHPASAKDAGWSDKKFHSMSTDLEASMDLGLEMVQRSVSSTVTKFESIGVKKENIPDIDYFVKLHHGLPLLHSCAIKLFKKRNGRGPSSFDEAAEFCLAVSKEGRGSYLDLTGKVRGGKDYRGATAKVLRNAKKTAGSSEGPQDGQGVPPVRDEVQEAIDKIMVISSTKPVNKQHLDTALKEALDKLSKII